jgi:glycosyltransferase involved in cell wall biosynthesis
MSKISIIAPVHTSSIREGYSERFLVEFFASLSYQTFKDFDIVVADHSVGDNLKAICDTFSHVLDIKYYKNDYMRGSTAANVNFGIKNATGEICKILFMDDFFAEQTGLQDTWDAFQENPDKKWLIAGSIDCMEDRTRFFNARLPRFDNPYVNGDNSTGNPSTYSVRREYAIDMDENLFWLVDGEYFIRSYWHYGMPIMLNKIVHCCRLHEDCNYLKPEFKALDQKERQYSVEKFRKMDEERANANRVPQ